MQTASVCLLYLMPGNSISLPAALSRLTVGQVSSLHHSSLHPARPCSNQCFSKSLAALPSLQDLVINFCHSSLLPEVTLP